MMGSLHRLPRWEARERAAISHTAHLTGSDVTYDALFRRCGIVRVNDPDERW